MGTKLWQVSLLPLLPYFKSLRVGEQVSQGKGITERARMREEFTARVIMASVFL